MKIAIADAQSHIRSALRLLISEKTGHLVVLEIKHTNTLLNQLVETPVNMLIADWSFLTPDVNMTLRTIRNNSTVKCIIVISSDASAQQLAIEAGADGFVSKSDVPETILTVLKQLDDNGHITI